MKFKLGKRFVDKISGPISMYCLDQCQQNLPFVILFGDDHSNSMFQCENCKCDTDSDNCCLAIFKNEIFEFLSLNSRNNVDIFVESMDEKLENVDFEKFSQYKKHIEQQLESEKPSGITKLFYKFRGCFYTIIKKNNFEMFKTICEFPTLNWIHNDIRQINFYSEENRLESLITNCWSDNLFGIIFYLKIHHVDQNIFNQKVVSDTLLYCFKSRQNLIYFCELMKKFYIINEFDEFFNIFLNQNFIKSFTKSAINKTNFQAFSRSFLEIYQNFIYPLIFKRINRYKNNTKPIDEINYKDFNNFKENVKSSFLKLSEFFEQFKNYIETPSVNNYERLYDQIKALLELVQEKDIDEIKIIKSSSIDGKILDLANIVHFLNCSLKDVHNILTSFFLDLINLFRVLSTKSKLSIFYCGEEHCKVLNEILLKVYNYQQRVAILPSKNLNRCLNISEVESSTKPGVFDIDLDEIV